MRAGIAALAALLAWPAPAPSIQADGVTPALRRVLTAPPVTCREPALDGRSLARFYPGPVPVSIWTRDDGPGPLARELRRLLDSAEDDGLSPARYAVQAIDDRWTARAPIDRACLDVLMTAAFDRYVRDLAGGALSPRDADATWHLRAGDVDPVAILHAAQTERALRTHLERLRPSHGLYRRLQAALARYRGIADDGGWNTESFRPVSVEERAPRAVLLERLRREGDLEAAGGAGQPDDVAVDLAVRRFQRRHGLAPDGIVGPRTRAALGTPVEERIAQIRRAMERVRWMPRSLGPHHVLVNSAGFELTVVEEDRALLAMKVIVGAPDQPTPSFSATIRSLVINPYWNVPVRIARDKLVPRERRDPGYLAARGFRVLDPRTGRWRSPDPALLAAKPVLLRQEPGPGNLMGRLSFVLPNPHDIFLHDTPDRALFEQDVRARSEGCVRIENAMALALHALRRAPDWTEERIQAEIDALHHRVLTLPEPTPVPIVYLPVWVDDGGVTHFRPDHYRRESELVRQFPP
jgi:murein L,D-transpeptidase YcbB/YkuD